MYTLFAYKALQLFNTVLFTDCHGDQYSWCTELQYQGICYNDPDACCDTCIRRYDQGQGIKLFYAI